MNRPALDSLCLGAEVLFEARGDLARGFIGEGESADARGVEAAFINEEADSFDETIRLSRTWPRQHEQRLRFCLDCGAL